MNAAHDFQRNCLANHVGLWAVSPEFIGPAINAIRAGLWPVLSAEAMERQSEAPDYTVQAGIAIISISGGITKGVSKFGGTSSVQTRQALRHATTDKEIRAIMLSVDSPGGTVAGIDDLAREIKRADGKKPVHAHIDGLGASAAFWVASQARRITASITSQVGSIGAMAIVEDSSGKAAMEGIKVHVIGSGPSKGEGVPGTEISEDMIDDLQRRIDGIGEVFFQAVAKGRGMTLAQVRKLADGRIYLAADAKELGLIDGVETFEEAAGRLIFDATPQSNGRRVSLGQELAIASQGDPTVFEEAWFRRALQ